MGPARIALMIAALAVLGACNIVTTKTPLFTKADAVGAARLRPGLWDEDAAADCTVDESKPLTDWPGCANSFVVIDDATFGGYSDENGKRVWSTASALLVGGDPMVFQIHATGDAKPGATPDAYVYSGVTPSKLDAQGRIVATLSWPVQCGKPPPADAKNPDGGQRTGTLEPLPGLTMDADGANCTTASPAALRAAAKASRKWTAPGETTAAHWVRDGDK
jgi:hypothetical protein